MRVVQAGYEILDTLNGEEILKKIERVARVCYKSEDKIGEGTAERMVKALIKRGHEAMLEHFFSLRACGTTGKPHPQMLEVAVPLLKEVKSLIPVVFDDLEPLES